MRRASLVVIAVLGALALPSTAGAVPTVTLTFDDGKNTQVDAAALLAAAGLPATFYINSSSIGGPFNMMTTSFYLGRQKLIATKRPGMAQWRERLFAWMNQNSESAMEFFKLPTNRVVELGSQVQI